MFDSSELEALWTYPDILTVTPLTGTTVTMPATQQFLYVTPAGTIAALTVRLPPNPQNGQGVAISFLQIVTTLTIQTSAAGRWRQRPARSAWAIFTATSRERGGAGHSVA